jgi:hypothetical protein
VSIRNDADGYRNTIVSYKGDSPVRLGDVARVVDGVENDQLAAWANGKPAVLLDIRRQPGANIVQTVDSIKALLPELRALLPANVSLDVFADRTITIRASVEDVEFTLILTICLVIAVIFVFLLYLLHTTGELCLSPVGLSAMARLAPRFMASLIMGAWFYMTAVGNFVAGKIGEATGGHTGEMTKEATLGIYNQIGWVAVVIGVVVLGLSPFIKRLMHLDTLKDDDLAGRDELAEPQAAGAHPEGETSPRPAGA